MFVLLIVIFACTKNTNNVNCKTTMQQADYQLNNKVDKNAITIGSIDTAEFIVFWKQFRKAILERDTTTLSTMINENIEGNFIHNKSLFLNNIDTIFKPEFLSLLKSYEIEKYLVANQENIFLKPEENKIYESYIDFRCVQINSDETTSNKVALYIMSYRQDSEQYPKNYVMQYFDDDCRAIELMFVKRLGGIRLYQIDILNVCDYIDICDSP